MGTCGEVLKARKCFLWTHPDQATHVYKRKAHDELVCHHALGEVSDEFIGASEVIFNDHDICCYIPGLFLLVL